MKKIKFILKGTIIFWAPILGGYVANILSNLIINLI